MRRDDNENDKTDTWWGTLVTEPTATQGLRWLLIPCFIGWIASGLTVTAGEAHYAYDDLGRLTVVVDDAGNTAIYNYDAVGNLLGIDRYTPRRKRNRHLCVAPRERSDRESGEDPRLWVRSDPSHNTVSFNGTAAFIR
jgi:YD repeat-containing protein